MAKININPEGWFALLLIAAIGLSGCNEQKRYVNRMEGSWNIARQETSVIGNDGTVTDVEVITDAGTLLLSEPSGGSDLFLDYTLTLSFSSFTWSGLPFKTDDFNKRVFFYNFFCPDLFGCDWVGTIEEDQPGKQVWVFFRRTTMNGAQAHRKTVWTLERE